MIIPNQKQSTVFFVVVILVTLFFGLKPKDYRFVNQVKPLAENSGLAFTNIGMVYSEKTMGETGITDSMAIEISIKPFSTGRRLSKVVTLINEKGNELLAIEQWTDALMATLYDSNGKAITRIGIRGLVKDSATQVFLAINERELDLKVGNIKQKRNIPKGVVTPGYFSHAYMIIGLSSSGQKPFRGELYKLALFNVAGSCPDSLEQNQLSGSLMATCSSAEGGGLLKAGTKPAAFFDFSGIKYRRVFDLSGNKWYLCIPAFPRIFKYRVLQPFKIVHGDDRSLITDMVINFLGFIPFGVAAFLFFFTRSKKVIKSMVYTIIISSFITFSIETAQIFIPTRESQISDVMLNIAGAATGALIVSASRFRQFYCKVPN
jgi:VanZ family protein